MGCASSKQTKVVKFQEPGSKNNNNNPTTTVTPPSAKQESEATKKSTNDVTPKNNAATAEQPDLTPVVEFPKTQQQQQQQQQQENGVPEKPTVNTDKDSKQQEYANSILAPIEIPPSGIEPSKDTNEASAAVKKEARPLSGGVWETRSTVIDATTSRIYSPTRIVSTAFASKTLTILHFNDVYNIEPREQEPVGGAARFVTKIKSFSESEAMVLFSGDLLNPSLSKYLC